MSIYSITDNNGSLLSIIDADEIKIRKSGQILIFKNKIIVGIFSKDCNCVSKDDYYKSMGETIEKNLRKMDDIIDNTDKTFFTDIFFKDKTPEEANTSMRKIYGIIRVHLANITKL